MMFASNLQCKRLSFCILAGFTLLSIAVTANIGQGFLAKDDARIVALSKRGPAELLAELVRVDKSDMMSHEDALRARTDQLEAALNPIFKVSPKDHTGRVDTKAARYLLHRVFVKRHAWKVDGIDFSRFTTNTSKIAEALQDGKFDLRQLARFGAMLETLIHVENIERLQRAFDALDLPLSAPLTESNQASKVIEAYMAMFLMAYLNKENPPSYHEIKHMMER